MSRPPLRWLAAWRRAWTIPWGRSALRTIFGLHVAPGLWLWGLLVAIAWSSVSFNLPSVDDPVMRTLLGSRPKPPVRAGAGGGPAASLDWRTAHALAKNAMAGKARDCGFVVLAERLMFFDPASRTYAYRVKSDLDPGRLGNTQITIDAGDGHVLAFARPTGAALGDTVTTWIAEIHTAGILGWPMKVGISIAGLAVATLSVTGVLIYVRKRRAAQVTA